MPFTQFQLIALETPTLVATNPEEMAAKDYLADFKDIDLKNFSADARKRINWIIGALSEALIHKDVEADKDTLKIFIAPEFFFRDQNEFSKDRKERFYDFETANAIESLFEVVFSDEALNQWLIVPGTMVRGDKDSNLITPNRVYAIMGGVKGEAAILTKHDKLNASDADAVPDASQKNFLPKLMKAKSVTRKNLIQYQLNSLKGSRTNIFTVGGHRIGIDICLDHKYGILRQTCEKYYAQNNVVTGVDLQLLGGMRDGRQLLGRRDS